MKVGGNENLGLAKKNPHPCPLPEYRARGLKAKGQEGRGFTLVEVLVALLLIGITLPAIMAGINGATAAASSARRRNEASILASSKLSEIISAQSWQNANLSGEFSPDWPDYHWSETASAWNQDTTGLGIEEVDVTVSWVERNRPVSLAVSTLVYPRASQ